MFLHRHFISKQAGSELDDVIRNLGHVLRTKQGCGSFLEGFGLSETGYRTPEEMLVDLSRELRDCITRYEPRIEIVEIEEVYSDEGKVSLVVHCRLRSSLEKLGIALDPSKRELSIGAK